MEQEKSSHENQIASSSDDSDNKFSRTLEEPELR
jgi:hypothetical protein